MASQVSGDFRGYFTPCIFYLSFSDPVGSWQEARANLGLMLARIQPAIATLQGCQAARLTRLRLGLVYTSIGCCPSEVANTYGPTGRQTEQNTFMER